MSGCRKGGDSLVMAITYQSGPVSNVYSSRCYESIPKEFHGRTAVLVGLVVRSLVK